MKIKLIIISILTVLILNGCLKEEENKITMDKEFQYVNESFADIQILRYRIPGFEELSLQQKELLYYLYKAGLSGRDIFYDQNYRHNLKVRRTLEAVIDNFKGNHEEDNFKNLLVYAKRVWFSNGIHHHYSTRKIMPEFSSDYFASLVHSTPENTLPLEEGETKDDLISFFNNVIFNPDVDAIRVNLNPAVDFVSASANNFYEGVTAKEVEEFYKKKMNPNDKTPISYGLNSKLIKENGELTEKVWKVSGMYSEAIEQIVYWLEKASSVSENEKQKKALDLLIEYYKTGDLRKFDEYNIAWVEDTDSRIDVVNGFIEVYGDPLGYRGAFESVVSFRDMEATERIDAISKEAQWFEDNSPINNKFKKENVVGISAKVITVVGESGDASPSTPIGINLPNANWIRQQHGSKSVNLGNIVEAYDNASSSGTLEEFSYSKEEIELAKKYGSLSGKLHTDLHEVIGHASGKINPGVGTPKQSLKNYASAIEEARADLVALYYILDPKLVEIGVMPSLEVGKAQYNHYIKNGMMLQLQRINLGDNLEQAHMRNRQTVSSWVYEKGKSDNVIEKKTRDGKTFFVVNDYEKLRNLFGEMLKEVQRITSEGDYAAAQNLIENYGVKINKELHKEVLDRFAKLNIAPYRGFINPVLNPVMEGDRIVDVKVEYPDNFTNQMLYYGKKYSFLPNRN